MKGFSEPGEVTPINRFSVSLAFVGRILGLTYTSSFRVLSRKSHRRQKGLYSAVRIFFSSKVA
jgi:hypothetical protein